MIIIIKLLQVNHYYYYYFFFIIFIILFIILVHLVGLTINVKNHQCINLIFIINIHMFIIGNLNNRLNYTYYLILFIN